MEQTTFSIITILRIIKKNLKAYIIGISTITFLVGIYAFSLPNVYTSSVKMVPEISNNNGLEGLSSAASLMGVNINGMGNTEDPFSADLYPEIVHSFKFLNNLSKTKVQLNDGKSNIKLEAYLTNFQKKPWWTSCFIFFSKTKEDKKDSILIDRNNLRISKEKMQLYKMLEKAIVLTTNKGTGEITIEVTFQDQYVAAMTAENISKLLQQYILDYRTNKAKQDLAYYEKLSKQSRNEYLKSMNKYSDYADANMDVALMGYKSKESNLENEMQIKFNNYSQMEQRKEAAKAKLQAKTPVFNIIEPATVPLLKSGPKRMIIIVLWNAIVICCLTIFFILKTKPKED